VTCVLFVDDEALVLQGLRRALTGMLPGCRMAFAASADAALAIMADDPAAIVVSDMRMPGRDGASLLTEVRERWPSTIRLLLTGQTGEQSVRAVGVAHQVLAKPVDTEVLATTLRRLLEAAAGAGTGMGALAAQAAELPTRPGTFAQFADLVAQDTSAADVATAIEADVAISGRVLQLVNSAFFGLPRRITGIAAAVTYLGSRTLQALVLSVEMERSLSGRIPADFPIVAIGNYSAEAAIRARGLAARPYSDTAFAAALLHDIGLLALASSRPDEVMRNLARATPQNPLTGIELQEWGFTHSQIGGSLLTMWGLPEDVAVAVGLHHHHPLLPPQQPGSLDALTAVEVALTSGPVGPVAC
jgi:HD-like signal output (HDOD) protein/CheY-like chemotaxis protein